MSIIVSYCQHCDEQQFQTLLCVHYTIFSGEELDVFIRALLLDRILALEKTTRTPSVHLVNNVYIIYRNGDIIAKMFIFKNNRNWLTIQDNMRCMIDVCVKTDQFKFTRLKVNLVFISKFLTSGDHTYQNV